MNKIIAKAFAPILIAFTLAGCSVTGSGGGRFGQVASPSGKMSVPFIEPGQPLPTRGIYVSAAEVHGNFFYVLGAEGTQVTCRVESDPSASGGMVVTSDGTVIDDGLPKPILAKELGLSALDGPKRTPVRFGRFGDAIEMAYMAANGQEVRVNGLSEEFRKQSLPELAQAAARGEAVLDKVCPHIAKTAGVPYRSQKTRYTP